MNEERWKRLDRVFQGAIEVPADRREAYLREACEGELAFRAEVESLLAHHDAAGAALDSPLAAPLAGARLAEGSHIGPYSIVRRLGAGGMGEVYLALDTRLDRKVALKILTPQLTGDAAFVARFQMEARAASALNHPNIVTVYEAGQIEGLAYLATEYVAGESLAERLSRAPLGSEEILSISSQVVSALEAAHGAGVIHRDVKPANIMIRSDGLVKVVDFGLAKVLARVESGSQEGTVRTSPGTIVGTAAYMSPEQAAAKPVDCRTDLWSLGATLYEMASRRQPFQGASMPQLMAAVLTEQPAELRGANAGLKAVVERALQKKPEARYQTAADLLADLRRLQRDPASSAWKISRRWVRVAVALAAVAVAAVLYWRRPASMPSLSDYSPATRLTVKGIPRKVAVSADGRYMAYASLDGADQSLWVHQVGPAIDLAVIPARPLEYVSVAFSPDGDYLYYVALDKGSPVGDLYRIPTLGGEPRRVLAHVDSPISFSPDGEDFAFVRNSAAEPRTRLMMARRDGTSVRELAPRSSPLYFSDKGPAWSPDGKYIALTARTDASRRLYRPAVVSLAEGTARILGSRSWGIGGKTVWADGQKGLIVQVGETGSRTLRLVHVSYPDGAVTELSRDLSSYFDFDLAPGQRLLVAVRRDYVSSVWATGGGDDVPRALTSSPGRYQGVAWQGNSVVVSADVAGQPDLWLIPAAGGSLRRLTEDASAETDPAPCGEGLVFSSTRGGDRNIWRLDRAESQPRQVTTGIGPDEMPQCTPDGRVLYYTTYSAGNAMMFRARMDGSPATPVTGSAASYGALSPDGRRIVCYLHDEPANQLGHVAILSAETGAVLRRFSDLPPEGRLGWIPGGDGVVYIKRESGAGNLWLRPLNDAPDRPLTRFLTEQLFTFALSGDGTVACVRGFRQAELVRMGGRK